MSPDEFEELQKVRKSLERIGDALDALTECMAMLTECMAKDKYGKWGIRHIMSV